MHIRHFAWVGLVLLAGVTLADQQQIAPGTGQQNSTVINTGTDGICNTTAAADDIQFAAVGSGRRVADAVGTRVDHSRVLLARARRDLLLIGERDTGEQCETHPGEVTNVHGALLAAKGLPQSPGRSQRKVSDLSRYGREARW